VELSFFNPIFVKPKIRSFKTRKPLVAPRRCTQTERMKSTTIFILLILFSQFLAGQNNCGDFKDYENSQLWIKEINQLNPNERKIKILERIKCEQKSDPKDIDFWLTIIIDGSSIFIAKDIPEKRNEILNLISENNFTIANSLCESEGTYPQRCNLGFALINGFEKPIFNDNNELKNITLKRKKRKIIIKLKSNQKKEIELKTTDFINPESLLTTEQIKIRKGRNRIVIKTDIKLKLIELESDGMKTIILK
jgi:hypothetical protein